eukprot:gene17471-26863_t
MRRAVQLVRMTALQRRHMAAAAPAPEQEAMEIRFAPPDLKPRDTVDVLDKFIVGQADAKKAVAIALRNRWRRHQVPEDMRDEVFPKNILMIGPT